MGRAPCCDKDNVKRGPWSPEEDAKLKTFIEKYGTGGNWIALPHKAGLKRCGKSCRLRWLNYLRPNIKHGEFTDDEDKIICSLYANIGSRWSIIAAQLPGRTDNDIKNYWNTKLKKKLMAMLPSFQKKPCFFPSLPPPPYKPDLFLTNNSSPFYNFTNPNFINLNNTTTTTTINSLQTTLVQDHVNFTHPDSNPLISLITNTSNNNQNCFQLGFQEDYHHQSMYNSPYMVMFGNNNNNGGGDGHEVSTTGSSSEGGGSCLSQISYSKNNYQIKQEDQFSLQGFGDQSQSFIIDHTYTDQKPKKYNSDVEEVKQQLIGNNCNISYFFNHEDDKEVCYNY